MSTLETMATEGNSKGGEAEARVAVIIPCLNDGELIGQAVRSVGESEATELVVVDDGSDDARTRDTLDQLEGDGVAVIRHPETRGVSTARMTGLEATSSRYVFPLDADDLAIPGVLALMADFLDRDQSAAACFGDYLEFGERVVVRGVPTTLDPYRLIYTNEYPASALFRRKTLDEVGGWQPLAPGELDVRSDWSLWMTLAEFGAKGIHAGPGVLTYLRRVHTGRLGSDGRARHRTVYRALRDKHPDLFTDVGAARRASDLRPARKLLYPIVYGRRPRYRFEPTVKKAMDALGVWTLQRRLTSSDRAQLDALTAMRAALVPARPQGVEIAADAAGAVEATAASTRIAVIVPCHDDGDLAVEAVRSTSEREPLEIIVVDDASTDPASQAALEQLVGEVRVLWLNENVGLSAARMAGLRASAAPYVFPLDADDQAVPGALARMADLLDRNPEAAVCFGDYEEFGTNELIRAVPDRLDPYRLAYTNEYPVSALFRREAIERAGGWQLRGGYEDWDLWLSLVELGAEGVHAGRGQPIYRRRLHGERMLKESKRRHRDIYREIRERHPVLFAETRRLRQQSDLGPIRKALYPIVYGGRRRWWFEPRVKRVFDRLGVWTLRR